MTDETFDRSSWERRPARALRESPEKLASRPPNAHLLAEIGDPATGAPTPAAGQVQVSVDEAVQALDPDEWQIILAEERLRTAVGTGADAIVRAVRHS